MIPTLVPYWKNAKTTKYLLLYSFLGLSRIARNFDILMLKPRVEVLRFNDTGEYYDLSP